MKLIRANFQNFRLLRDLELEFSQDQNRRLTVIRAANESGKTTILHGLRWALYGDEALPSKRRGFRLHPIDWDVVVNGDRVPVVATVEFETTTYNPSAGTVRAVNRRYRIVRATTDVIQSGGALSGHSPGPTTVKLFQLTEAGAKSVDAPESVIRELLPPELSEVFFTDGDRALSFIEADAPLSKKRERVRQAIRSLLSLEVIEDAIGHLGKAAAATNRKAKAVTTGGRLEEVVSRLEGLEEEREKLKGNLSDAKTQWAAFDARVRSVDRLIAEALEKGDKEALSRQREDVKREIGRLDAEITEANKRHSELFRGREVAGGILTPILSRGLEQLETLREEGRIPNTTIPVLQDRLVAGTCICGEGLDPDEAKGRSRRAHIEGLIEKSRRADDIQKVITELYYSTKPLHGDQPSSETAWLTAYEQVVSRRTSLEEGRDEAGRRLRFVEEQVASLPDTDIQGLREVLDEHREQRNRHLTAGTRYETQLEGLRGEREELVARRKQLLQQEKKGALILAELTVTQDVKNALEGAYDQITTKELRKVSDLMNDIFLEMIGADPEQDAIIQKAEISKTYDIRVYGPDKRALDPDLDLNGASRRALTLAFILALTKVSEVKAPNVIDTPLGMTSGFVKRSILRTCIRESNQLILLLTHAEIVECEEIIDEEADVVFTLTNPAHYPTILEYAPEVEEYKILRCDCTHRHECKRCQRRVDPALTI